MRLQVGEVFFITGDFGALESHEMSGLIFPKSQCSSQTAILLAFGRVWKDICYRIDVFGIFRDFQGFSPQEIRRLSSSRPTPEALKLKPAKRCHPPQKNEFPTQNEFPTFTTVLWAMNGYDGLCTFFVG